MTFPTFGQLIIGLRNNQIRQESDLDDRQEKELLNIQVIVIQYLVTQHG